MSLDSRAKKKKRKDDSSDPSLSNDSDSSDDNHYRIKRHNNKKHRENDTIRLCATLTAKLLTTAYKLKIISFKMDEDPLQRRIYFLTFIDSLDMIFKQISGHTEIGRASCVHLSLSPMNQMMKVHGPGSLPVLRFFMF